jgi:hypothetical protein
MQNKTIQDDDIKLIVEAIHRDAQRCDNIAEEHTIAGNVINSNFYIKKATRLRSLANTLTESATGINSKNTKVIKALPPVTHTAIIEPPKPAPVVQSEPVVATKVFIKPEPMSTPKPAFDPNTVSVKVFTPTNNTTTKACFQAIKVLPGSNKGW